MVYRYRIESNDILISDFKSVYLQQKEHHTNGCILWHANAFVGVHSLQIAASQASFCFESAGKQ